MFSDANIHLLSRSGVALSCTGSDVGADGVGADGVAAIDVVDGVAVVGNCSCVDAIIQSMAG